jgi:hypothetical protein
MKKINAYLILSYHNGNEIQDCGGLIVDEYGNILGQHHSSSFAWLRLDLMNKSDIDYNIYSVVDLIGKEVPQDLIDKINNKNK